MSHPNNHSLAEQAKALLAEAPHGASLPTDKTATADIYAKLEIARQIGRVADALERLPHNLDRH